MLLIIFTASLQHAAALRLGRWTGGPKNAILALKHVADADGVPMTIAVVLMSGASTLAELVFEVYRRTSADDCHHVDPVTAAVLRHRGNRMA